MKNIPLQTIFFKFIRLWNHYFPKSPSCKQFFLHYSFYNVIFFGAKKYFSYFSKKKIPNTRANNYYFSHLYAPVVVYSLLFLYNLFTVLIPICS